MRMDVTSAAAAAVVTLVWLECGAAKQLTEVAEMVSWNAVLNAFLGDAPQIALLQQPMFGV
jgi:hypothetical protein